MIYDIQSKNDLTGSMLTVRIPEQELDHKALYTIQHAAPEFIVPFRTRSIDGEIELTYQLGTRSRLQYFYGTRSPREYVELWSTILTPLLDCDDWFMNPFSFVLQTEYLYYDKISEVVSFVYIPSVRPAADYEGLRTMAGELAKNFPVTDTLLENQVLRALMQSFNPKQFLQMLKDSLRPDTPAAHVSSIPVAKPIAAEQVQVPRQEAVVRQPERMPENEPWKKPSSPSGLSGEHGDIHINLDGNAFGGAEAAKPDKWKLSLFNKKNEPEKAKPEKPGKPEKPKSRLFAGKKKDEAKEVIVGAAARQNIASQHIPLQSEPAVVQSYGGGPYSQQMDNDVTELEEDSPHRVQLRSIGNRELPESIAVSVSIGQVFTIGRFDASVGRQQSSFEFAKTLKAISRRHTAIERAADGYRIIDLTSSAGTFVNSQKLVPGSPLKLNRGDRVSFGNAGADYIWEE
ncbi:FHA domain-containing protein [Paenibacillus sp. MMS20-IR301]|uniref:FHA domain-containing protein n=1 Tax=Paenibacillus sp. MMS20-IR301 TaxID=2895946 RepID=UPI0028EE9376|nr:FHA domain-containing protein [Paenibacillus sp. MMS20-IR301]WNS42907.1 FHA domain-containing protein [Paenibacillus sp. MMS20-IR301]